MREGRSKSKKAKKSESTAMVKWETHDFQKVRKQFVSVRVRLAVKNLFYQRAPQMPSLTKQSLWRSKAMPAAKGSYSATLKRDDFITFSEDKTESVHFWFQLGWSAKMKPSWSAKLKRAILLIEELFDIGNEFFHIERKF
jgi:hypothetical protein